MHRRFFYGAFLTEAIFVLKRGVVVVGLYHRSIALYFIIIRRAKMLHKGYPIPLVISPLSGSHTHTIISLHGRGSNAECYGYELLESASLQSRLPRAKFIFPTARKRRSIILKRIPINQWFDNYSFEDPGQKKECK